MILNRHPCTVRSALKASQPDRHTLKTHRISSTLEDFQPYRTTTSHNCICAKSITMFIDVHEEI